MNKSFSFKSSNETFKEIISVPEYNLICRKDIYSFPRPFYKNIKEVKAIILGADPSNPQDKTFEFVFGLERGEKSPYFNSILKNLEFLGLSFNNIYVQNLCKNYFTEVTDKNNSFLEIAEKFWLPQLKNELDNLFPTNIPVIVTAWKVLEVITPEINQYKKSPKNIYNNCIIFPETKLNRTAIALFRGGNGYYSLSQEKYKNYIKKISELL